MIERQWDESEVAEAEQRDKWRTAIHEAGHVTVAAAKGLRASASLYRSNTSRPLEEKIWLGHAQVTGVDDPAYAVAGMIAEQLDRDADVQGWQVIEEWEIAGEMLLGLSHTDMQLMPQNWSARAAVVEEALTILRDHKFLFDRIVSELVECECVTNGMVAAWIRERRD